MVSSLRAVALLLAASVVASASLAIPQYDASPPSDYPRRRKLSDGGGDDGSEDEEEADIDRDAVCKSYLESFLRGSTDARDECQGLLNAYDGAGCSEEEGGGDRGDFERWWRWWWHKIFGGDDDGGGGGGGSGNSTEDDDLTDIDDFFEHFRCCDAIHSYYAAHCHEPRISSVTVLCVLSALVLCGLVKALIRTLRVGWLPEAGGCILVGAAFGALLKADHPEMDVGNLSFDEDLFLCVLLPPIVFRAALGIDKAAFRRHLFPVGVFAVFGTAVSAALTGLIVCGITAACRFLPSIPLLDSLVFGSLISSVDPVATLSILSSVGVAETDKLYILVFGESLLNDGVAVVLFRTLVSHLERDAAVDESIFWESVREFLLVSAGSVAIGLGCSMLCLVYFWALRHKQDPVLEVVIFFCFALIPYYVADSVGASGIIAVMTAGFFMDVYVIGDRNVAAVMMDEGGSVDARGGIGGEGPFPHPVPACAFPTQQDVRTIFSGGGYLSNLATRHIDFVAEVGSSVMETAIFAYLGLFLFVDKRLRNVPLNLTAISACVLSRLVAIVALSWAVNVAQSAWWSCRCGHANPLPRASLHPGPSGPDRPDHVIDGRTQLVLLLSGMRGAVSLALVESVPLHNAVTGRGSRFKPELKAMASSSVIFTVFNLGALTYYLLEQRGRLAPALQATGSAEGSDEEVAPLQEPLIASEAHAAGDAQGTAS